MGWEAATSGNAIPAPIPASIRCTISRRVSVRPTDCPCPIRCNRSSFVTRVASQSLYGWQSELCSKFSRLMVTLGLCMVTSAMSTRDNFACRLQRQVDKADPRLRSALHPLRLTRLCWLASIRKS